ncbi:MAG TPA: fumarylacetoacetate hydrolase family protein, partial [Calditrichia bacterium]|nr:fumarylacetoacetate hydrolase family protein [Calditrichia bacterium]
CIGRNYAAHARELNNPVPGEPVVFTKPLTTIVHNGGKIILPPQSRDVHYETEIVVLIGKSGKNIAREEAPAYIAGYGIGLDITARDIQSRAKEKAHPWAVAKGFDTFAPISDFVPAHIFDPGKPMRFSMSLNGERRQEGDSSDMLFPIPDLIAYLSSIFTLHPGDVIFTGTPEGVGAVSEGDVLRAVLGEDLAVLEVGAQRE